MLKGMLFVLIEFKPETCGIPKSKEEKSLLHHSISWLEKLYCIQLQLLLGNQHATEYKLIYTTLTYVYGKQLMSEKNNEKKSQRRNHSAKERNKQKNKRKTFHANLNI